MVHLARQGYIARGGQILDASITRQVIAGNHREGIVPVPRNHNTREENAAIKADEVPPLGHVNMPCRAMEGWENKPAKRSQKDVDAPLSGIQGMPCRAMVEHVFGAQANDMGGTLVRTIGLVRAKATIGMKNIAYNIRRLGQLHRLNPFPA